MSPRSIAAHVPGQQFGDVGSCRPGSATSRGRSLIATHATTNGVTCLGSVSAWLPILAKPLTSTGAMLYESTLLTVVSQATLDRTHCGNVGVVTARVRTTGGLSVLDVRDLVLRFGGITALDKISFTVADNEICGLIGPNGAGKTSLFNCVTRVYRPDRGVDQLRRHRPAGAAPAPDREEGRGPHLPEPGPVPVTHGDAERHGRSALEIDAAPAAHRGELADDPSRPAPTRVRGLVPDGRTRPERRRLPAGARACRSAP